MKFTIKHETKQRMRIHVAGQKMTYEQADILMYYLHNEKQITFVKVYERTGDAVIEYTGKRSDVILLLQRFRYEQVHLPVGVLENSGREVNAAYQEKLVGKVVMRYAAKWLLPYPIRAGLVTLKSLKYIKNGVKTLAKGKIEVPVLDATAIAVSILRNDIDTAGSVMFLLGIGELLEEWTHKKSVEDLARSMSLNVSKVWLVHEDGEVLVSAEEVQKGDHVVVHMGNVIPFDGNVVAGEAMVNQASLTGESVAVRRMEGATVYAGTVVEEGELTILVKETEGASKFEKIVAMIEESEKLKSGLESKAEHLADRLVPCSLGGTVLTYLLTRNVTKALSILMVDFSCALKLAMPISVLSAIREASLKDVTVKGGKFLEAVAEADTIVFDKTGTLTKAKPTVADVISFNGDDPDELLRIAACLEEHFPHSMANAVINTLHKIGIKKIVMMTGDSERTAAAVAAHVGVDEYYSEVLPEDKAGFIEKERAAGRKVIMVGDGINDSPALSAADVGIAINDGAEIAREIADITVGADDLYQLVTLKALSDGLMKKIQKNYRFIVGFNSILIALGIGGVIRPTTSALLHNGSTLYISLKSMNNILN